MRLRTGRGGAATCSFILLPRFVCVCVWGGQKGDVWGGGEVADRILGWPGVHAGATVDNR